MKALHEIAGRVPQAIGKEKTFIIFTDSSITIDSLKNPHNHKSIIQNIREKVIELEENNNWKIQLMWDKAHIGLYNNDMADKLAKEVATDRKLQACYDKTQKGSFQVN